MNEAGWQFNTQRPETAGSDRSIRGHPHVTASRNKSSERMEQILGKCTHQCDETQGNNSARALSTKTVMSFGCKKIDIDNKRRRKQRRGQEEGSKEGDRPEGTDVTNVKKVASRETFLFYYFIL